MHVIKVRKIGVKPKYKKRKKKNKRGGYLPRVHPDNIFTQAKGYKRDSQGRLWKNRPGGEPFNVWNSQENARVRRDTRLKREARLKRKGQKKQP